MVTEHPITVPTVKAKNLKGKNVLISNSLNRSALGLSLAEKRLVYCALVNMRSLGKFTTITVTAKEYAKIFGMTLNQAYEQMKETAQELPLKTFRFLYEEDKGTRETWIVPWFSGVGYADGQGYVKIKFNPDIQDLLFDVTERFTYYQLAQASSLRSIYSWRLLEKFEQYRMTENGDKRESGWYKVSVTDFCRQMEAPDQCLSNFAQLRRKVIEPAIKELTEKDGWNINLEIEKDGRKVSMLTFRFSRISRTQPEKTAYPKKKVITATAYENFLIAKEGTEYVGKDGAEYGKYGICLLRKDDQRTVAEGMVKTMFEKGVLTLKD